MSGSESRDLEASYSPLYFQNLEYNLTSVGKMFVALGFTHSFRTCKRTHGGMRRFPEFGV
jgi:hypothetical protein